MIKILTYIFILFVTLFLYQNCEPYHEQGNLNLGSSGLNADPALQAQSLSILSDKCLSCHDNVGSGNVSNIADPTHLVQAGLVTAGDPTKGRLIGSIDDGSMAPSGSLQVTANELDTLRAWITSMNIAGDLPPAPAPIPLEATFTSISENILKPLCIDCHKAGGSRSSEQYTSYSLSLSTGKIIPGNPTGSAMYQEVLNNSMPENPYRRLTTEEKQAIFDWIQAGALNN